MRGLRLGVLLVVAALAGGLAVWIGLRSREALSVSLSVSKERAEASAQAPEAKKIPGVVRLDSESQRRADIRTAPPARYSLQPQIVAYGRLEEDPARSFTVRAPLAGTLLAGDGQTWPALGQTIPDGAMIGLIQPRLAAADQISLTNLLNAAKSELRASESARETARLGLERARILNADRKNVSDRVLQEAESRWNAEEARWNTAQEAARLLEASLQSMGPGGRGALAALRGGEVVDVMAHPGEAIESGQPIVRLARFDQLLARVALPVAQNAPSDATHALISVVGIEGRPVTGERVALASSIDPRIQSTSLVFRLNQPPPGSRPGLAVTARVGVSGLARCGYLAPRASVVHFRGKSYVYVEKETGVFERREIEAPEPVDGGYFTTNLGKEDHVVINGAQALLSEENKTGLEVEGE